MAENSGHAAINMSADVQAAIASAFRAAFLMIAAFTAMGFFLALTIPMRRI